MPAKLDAHERMLLAALLIFVAGLCLQPVTESDLFFRLKVGREILSSHRLLGRNLFSFTAPDHPDLDLSWGFEVAVAALYRLAGFRGVVVAKSIWMVATFAGAFAVCRRRGAGPLASAIALAAAALVMRERLVERPHVVSFAGEVAVVWALAQPEGYWAPRRVVGFFAGMVIWANTHAGVFTGVLMSLLAAGGALPVDRPRARRARALAFGICLAAAINPVGPVGIVRYLSLHSTIPRWHSIDEFRTATWRSDASFLVWVMVLVAVGVVGTRFFIRRRANAAGADQHPVGAVRALSSVGDDLPDWLPVLGMVLLGLCTIRFSADAVLVSAPLLATGVSRLVDGFARQKSSPALGEVGGGSWAAPVLTAALLIAATLAPRLADARAGRPLVETDIDAGSLPLGAIRFVEENGLRERMYNDFELGSYLLFEGYPRYRVFVDPRLPAYPEDMHRLLGSFDLDRAAWGAAMDRYGVQSALLTYAGINRRVAWWAPDDWALVYRASGTRVFVRRLEKWRDLIATLEIPATFDFTVEQGAITRPLDVRPTRSPVSDCEWQRRLGDLVFDLDGGATARARGHFERALDEPGCLADKDETRLAAWMGAIDMSERDRGSHALEHLDRALFLAPGDTKTRANRAMVLERLGRRNEAAADWNRVAAESHGTAVGDAAAARARRIVGVPPVTPP